MACEYRVGETVGDHPGRQSTTFHSSLSTIHISALRRIYPPPSNTTESHPVTPVAWSPGCHHWRGLYIDKAPTCHAAPFTPHPSFPLCPDLHILEIKQNITSPKKLSHMYSTPRVEFTTPMCFSCTLTAFFQSTSSFQIQLVFVFCLVYLLIIWIQSTLLLPSWFWLLPFVLIKTLKAASDNLSLKY